jgi:hypothetical protein
MLHQDVLLPNERHESNGSAKSRIGTSKTMSQSKPFLFMSWLFQVFVTAMENWQDHGNNELSLSKIPDFLDQSSSLNHDPSPSLYFKEWDSLDPSRGNAFQKML